MRSLRRALLAYILSGLVLVLVLSGIAAYLVTSNRLRAEFDAALATRAETFASLVIEERYDPKDPEGDVGLVFDYKGPLTEANLGVFLRVTSADGEVLALSPDWSDTPDDDAPSPSASETPEEEETEDQPPAFPPAGNPAVFTDVETKDERDARIVAIVRLATMEPEEDAPNDAPRVASAHAVLVEVAGSTEAIEEAEAALLVALYIAGFLAAAGTTAAVWFGIGKGLRPVGRLCAELDHVDARALNKPSKPGDYPEELRPIVLALDKLLDRVKIVMERERRFTDAAAHELRTPIAELRAITDVAGLWPDEERQRRAVSEARLIADEMEALLESLLAIARGESVGASQRAEPIALLPLARMLAAGRAEQLRARDVKCEIEGSERAEWTAPKAAVVAIVRNLIDNAAEYTPQGGSVRIHAKSNGEGSSIEVENGPVSLESGETERLFEPFWRADASRSDRAHRGLGLSIVASLGDALGLRREVALTPERRLRIRLTS